MASPGLLDKVVRMISVSFITRNPEVVPRSLRREKEKQESPPAGRSLVKGVRFIDRTPEVSLSGLLSALEGAGFSLVNGVVKTREDQGKDQYFIRYDFARDDGRDLNPQFLALRDDMRRDFQILCISRWQAQGFVNAFFENGQVLPGASAIALKLDSRNSNQGEPKAFLRIKDNAVVLDAAEKVEAA